MQHNKSPRGSLAEPQIKSANANERNETPMTFVRSTCFFAYTRRGDLQKAQKQSLRSREMSLIGLILRHRIFQKRRVLIK